MADLFRRVIEEVKSLPGVTSAGTASGGPLFGGGDGQVKFLIEGRPAPASPIEFPQASRYDMLPGYFRTLGIALRRGRFFDRGDAKGTPSVAIVNETLAHRYWPGQDPVGQRIQLTDFGDGPVEMDIVGVVADVPPFRPDRSAEPEIYWPLPQRPRWGTMLVVRTQRNLDDVTPAILNRVASVEPDLQVGTMRTMNDHMGRRLVRPRFFMLLMGVFAAVALVISAVGLYAVISYSVAQRKREIGVRLALGANRQDVLRIVLKRGLGLTVIGLAVGLAGALTSTRLLASLLVNVAPNDVLTLTASSVLLVAVSLIACLLPARRAMRVDPVVVLRSE